MQIIIINEKIAKEVIKDIGYQEEYQVIVKVSKQSKEINQAVCKEKPEKTTEGCTKTDSPPTQSDTDCGNWHARMEYL